jgi:probable F420-dependent oxidoreductase
MAYLAGLTSRIKLVTGVLGLPQRQTALVAKQAAQVDILTGGRVILGVGLGYNAVEFAALGVDIKERARRFEEQIDVLRMLWTQEIVSYKGAYHDLDFVNVNPLPIQRPIPIWIGAGRTENPIPPDKVLQRIGRKADGWCPLFKIADGAETLDSGARQAIEKVSGAAVSAGRDPAAIGLELGLFPDGKDRARVLEEIAALHAEGAGHLHVRFGAQSARGQIDRLKRFMDTIA